MPIAASGSDPRSVGGTAAPAPTLHPIADAYAADGLSALSALEQAQRIADGSLTSAELVEHYLGRIARHGPGLGAFVQVLSSSARREAERADRMRSRGLPLGPFHGVPTAVKDHHLVRFTRTRLGSRAFEWLWTPFDDGVVRRLRRAGFVIVGKTSMSELGLLPIVETDLHPPTRNPWDLMRTAGGSSGGAGAAVAAGLLPFAPGSDGAGSVRIPAALNGLVGLKPTRRLVPDGAERIDRFGLTVIGPMARSLDDAAALLDVLAAKPAGHYLARSRHPVERLRVGLVLEAPFGEVDPRIAARVEAAAERLQAAGHHVERRSHPSASLEDFTPLYQRFISRIPVVRRDHLQPAVRWFWEEGRRVSESHAWQRFREFESLGARAMDGLDALLTPTIGVVAPLVGAFAHLPPRELFEAAAVLGTFTALANVTGQPAITVPFGRVEQLPVGVQLIGHKGDDARLLALARALEGEAM